eukprot:728604-Rhodomonas_salina.1
MTEAVSYDTSQVSAISSVNHATTGKGGLTVMGVNLGAAAYSPVGQAGQSVCEVTVWASDSSVAYSTAAGVGQSLSAVVTAGNGAGTVTDAVTYVGHGGVVVADWNSGVSGGSLLVVSGSGMGVAAYSAQSELGSSRSQQTLWTSDSSVACKLEAGLQSTIRAVVTAGTGTGTVSEVGTYDANSVTGVGKTNIGTTGQGSVTVIGAELGRASYSVASGMGETGCEATEGAAESSLACRAGAGVGGSLRAV